MTSVKPLAMMLALALGLVALLFGHFSRIRERPRVAVVDDESP